MQDRLYVVVQSACNQRFELFAWIIAHANNAIAAPSFQPQQPVDTHAVRVRD